MLLAIDIGNTKTSIAVFDAGQMVLRYDFDTLCDPRKALLDPKSGVVANAGIALHDFEGACMASVVPQVSAAWEDTVRESLQVDVLSCASQTAEAAGVFAADYPRPETIGADRVANCIAARALHASPVLVVDFGTATDFEVIDRRGRFVGGVIAPGLDTSKNALFSHACKLHEIEIFAPSAVVGTDTESAMLSGIVIGEACRAEGLIARIADALGYRPTVVATGGRARLVSGFMGGVDCVDANLTLRGLDILYRSANTQ